MKVNSTVRLLLATAVLFCLLAPAMLYAQDSAAPGSTPGEGMTVTELMMTGGVVMLAILIISFMALALIFYHFFALRMGRSIPKEMIRQVWILLGDGKLREALILCNRSDSASGRLMAAGISRANQDPKILASALEIVGEKEAERLTDKIIYLSNIATITPMLGLLGTVLGMIKTFNVVVLQANLVEPWQLAAGISQALVTTAAGLIVAIPTMAMYYYFRGRSRRILTDLEQLSEELVEKLARAPRMTGWQEARQ